MVVVVVVVFVVFVVVVVVVVVEASDDKCDCLIDAIDDDEPADVSDSDGYDSYSSWREPAIEWLPEEVAGGGEGGGGGGGAGGSASASFPVRCICSVVCDEFDDASNPLEGHGARMPWEGGGAGGGGSWEARGTTGRGGKQTAHDEEVGWGWGGERDAELRLGRRLLASLRLPISPLFSPPARTPCLGFRVQGSGCRV